MSLWVPLPMIQGPARAIAQGLSAKGTERGRQRTFRLPERREGHPMVGRAESGRFGPGVLAQTPAAR
jgi:hypothetical protein